MIEEKMLAYNALDSACTFAVNDGFTMPPEFDWAYALTISLFAPLMYMQTRGIKVDLQKLSETKELITKLTGEKQEELNKICGRELNVNSSKDCQRYFYIEKGIAPIYNRKTGGVTTDDSALQRMVRGTAARPGSKEAKLVQEIRGLVKLYGTYLDIDFDTDHRLRCSYNPRGTTTGRLSSSKTVFGTGTNNENLPPEFKKFLVADSGYAMVEVDKKQAEWVAVAYLSGDANMLKVIEEGLDPHTSTAKLMFHVPEEQVLAEHNLVGVSTDQEFIDEKRRELGIDKPGLPRSMSMRQCGKKSNHGLNYDEGYRTFALINEFPETESKRVVELYHSIYPAIRLNYYTAIQAQLRKNRTITNCFGRPRIFLDAWGDSLFKAAYAFVPQSTVVDGLNLGMVEMYNDVLSPVKHCELLAQVHDSILFQFPLEHLEDLSRAMIQIYHNVSPTMKYNNRTFEIDTDMKVGLNWGKHSKDNPEGMRDCTIITCKKTIQEMLSAEQSPA